MQNVLIDVFNDLRARRLLPVAAVLLAALVAAPIVLSKKSDESPAPSTETATPAQTQPSQGPDELAQVKLSDDLERGSSLSAFEASNPFAPPKTVLDQREATQNPTITGDEATSPAGGEIPSGETTPGGTTPGTGEGEGGGTGGGEQTTEFAYVIDVTFWRNGHRRQIKGMEKLDVLPGQANPLLIFMGASSGGGNAVFLVDATLQTTGEGKCKPSRSECAFLSLGAGAEQEFTTEDGDSYRLRIDQIRKEKVGDDSSESGTAASEKKSKSARAAVDGSAGARRFVLPDLTDLVEVTNGNDSTGDEERR